MKFHATSLIILLLQFGFMFIALIWKFDFAPFMVLIIAILNDGKTVVFHSFTPVLIINADQEEPVWLIIYTNLRNDHDDLQRSSEAISTAR